MCVVEECAYIPLERAVLSRLPSAVVSAMKSNTLTDGSNDAGYISATVLMLVDEWVGR